MVYLLHDNTRSRPLYSLDLPPFHSHLLLNLKKYLGGKIMETVEKLKTKVTQYLKKKVAASFFEAGIQKQYASKL